MSNWLIQNAELTNEGRRFHADVRIRDGRIERIDSQLSAVAGEQVVDGSGCWLLPGMIDDQVHFREPGLTDKADIAHESRACVAGGITSFMDMPNTIPPALDGATLEDKYRRAQAVSMANHAFYLGASNDNLDAIARLDPRSTPGVKVFMGASTGNMLVDDPRTLDGIFATAQVPIITHCEDTPMIAANEAAAKARFGDDIPAAQHALIRSREACIKSTRLALELARRHDARLHVLHISTAEECELFAAGPIADKRITAETCVHFLHFSDADYARLGHRIKCNPSIKTDADRHALIAALTAGQIDVLATDHAPHLLAEKSQPYTRAPSGLPLVQFALQCAIQHIGEDGLSLERVVETTSHAPATLFGIDRRGFLREGYFADLVLVDPTRPYTVDRENVLSKCAWSPFEGETFNSTIRSTWVNGQRVWHDGAIVDATARGMRLAFTR